MLIPFWELENVYRKPVFRSFWLPPHSSIFPSSVVHTRIAPGRECLVPPLLSVPFRGHCSSQGRAASRSCGNAVEPSATLCRTKGRRWRPPRRGMQTTRPKVWQTRAIGLCLNTFSACPCGGGALATYLSTMCFCGGIAGDPQASAPATCVFDVLFRASPAAYSWAVLGPISATSRKYIFWRSSGSVPMFGDPGVWLGRRCRTSPPLVASSLRGLFSRSAREQGRFARPLIGEVIALSVSRRSCCSLQSKPFLEQLLVETPSSLCGRLVHRHAATNRSRMIAAGRSSEHEKHVRYDAIA